MAEATAIPSDAWTTLETGIQPPAPFLYEEGPKGDFPPTARDISIQNVKASAAPRLFFIQGFEGATIEGIRAANSEIVRATTGLQRRTRGRRAVAPAPSRLAGRRLPLLSAGIRQQMRAWHLLCPWT
jgi:hypothetical protein